MATVISAILTAAILLSGCSPKWTPYVPDYDVHRYYSPGKQPLRAHQPLVDVRYQFTLPVYTPVAACQPPSGKTHWIPALAPGQDWVAIGTLDPDALILHLDAQSDARSETPPGIAIYRDGRLYSSRPWFDLQNQARIDQPPWRSRSAQIFEMKGVYRLDCFASDLVYRGRTDAHLLFEERAYTCMSAVPAASRDLAMPSGKPFILEFDRVRIHVTETENRQADYMVHENPQDSASPQEEN